MIVGLGFGCCPRYMSDEKGKKTGSCNSCNVFRHETYYVCGPVFLKILSDDIARQ